MALSGICRAAASDVARMTISDIYYNDAYGMWGIEIGMTNPGIPVNAFQCDVAIPTAFSFTPDGDSWLYAFTSRVPQTTNALGQSTSTHLCATALRSNGTLRIVVHSVGNTPFNGTEGPMMFVALTPADGAAVDAAQTYEANLTNQVLTYMEDDAVTSVYPEGVINDDALTCYDSMGNYVMWCADSINGNGYKDNDKAWYDDNASIANDLATNDRVVTIDLTSFCYNTLTQFAPANPNALFICRAESQLQREENVIFPTGPYRSRWRCRNLVLYDYDNDTDVKGLSFEQPFGLDITADRFTLHRTFPAGQWSTVILPVTLSGEQMSVLANNGVSIARLGDFDADKAEITYARVNSFEANTPYLIRPASSAQIFDGLTDVPVESTYYNSAVTVGNLSMHGNYDYRLICSTADAVRYGYDVSTGEFIKIGNDCRLNPFRCYLELTGVSSAKAAASIAVRADDAPMGISEVNTGIPDGCAPVIFSLDGRRIMNATPESLRAGVYIIDGRKVVVK